jgi:hypothetical protein
LKKNAPTLVLTTLEDKGIKLSGEKVDLDYEKLRTRRRLLLSLIEDDGWEWADLNCGSYSHEITMNKT